MLHLRPSSLIRISTFVLRHFSDISTLPVAAFPGILFVNSRFNGAPSVYVRSNA
jgi:hypothetical protein